MRTLIFSVLLIAWVAQAQTQEQVLKDTIQTLRDLSKEPVPGPYDKVDIERQLENIQDAIIFNAIEDDK